MGYKVKTPWWLSNLLYRNLIWKLPAQNTPTIYLTFDDGPHETATPFALSTLNKYNAKATFFCLGKNVLAHPDIYQEILKEGHSTGNHTHNHLNGWQSKNKDYINNILTAAAVIKTPLFRPPYGKITFSQSRILRNIHNFKIIMWDVLSGDFDVDLTPQQCVENVIKNIEPGSIVVFHDSAKAWDRMSYALPLVLEYCQNKGWNMAALPND